MQNNHRLDTMLNAPCGSVDHRLHRRLFLQGSLAGAASVASFQSLFSVPAFADSARAQGKRCILLWLCGAPSQFETWDPKPSRPTGGPFASIPTSIPGVHISELMPKTASIMDKLTVVRSMSTEPSEHFQAIDMLTRGEPPRPPFTRPLMGSVLAKQLGQLDSPVPQFVLLDPCPEGNEFKAFKAANWAGWLGAEYGPVRFGGKYKLENVNLPNDLSATDHSDREALRSFLSKKFANDHKAASVQSYNSVFERVRGLMQAAPLFDLSALPQADRIVFHLINDLADRGMLDDTLVLIMGEFGRTPWLNEARGRDHYPKAWSMAMAGCGLKPGVVYGSTDENGVEVSDRPLDQRRLFATIYRALGLDPHVTYDLPDFPTFNRVEKDAAPVAELLA